MVVLTIIEHSCTKACGCKCKIISIILKFSFNFISYHKDKESRHRRDHQAGEIEV